MNIDSFLQTKIQEVARGKTFVLGVSGGVDSMVMLHAMRKQQCPIAVVCINYKTRGTASDDDLALVSEYCTSYQIPFWGVEMDAKLASGNFQAWARNVRYEVFEKVMDETKADFICTAHHYDDQTETILMKMLQGASSRHWSGMELVDGNRFRPLLPFTKEEILAYATHENVPWRADESNATDDYARNALRNKVFPVLDEFFGGWQENLRKAADTGVSYHAYICAQLDEITDGAILDLEAFAKKNHTERMALMAEMIARMYGEKSYQISRGAIAQLAQIPCALETGKQFILAEGCYVLRNRNQAIFRKEDARASDHQVDIRMAPSELPAHTIPLLGVHVSRELFKHPDANKLQLRWEGCLPEIRIRNWKPGDRMQPLGMQGQQKVSDLLINHKFPLHKKNEVLVVESFEEKILAIIFPANVFPGKAGVLSNLAKCAVGDEALTIHTNPKHEHEIS